MIKICIKDDVWQWCGCVIMMCVKDGVWYRYVYGRWYMLKMVCDQDERVRIKNGMGKMVYNKYIY